MTEEETLGASASTHSLLLLSVIEEELALAVQAEHDDYEPAKAANEAARLLSRCPRLVAALLDEQPSRDAPRVRDETFFRVKRELERENERYRQALERGAGALSDAIAHNVNATPEDSAGWTQEDYDEWDAARSSMFAALQTSHGPSRGAQDPQTVPAHQPDTSEGAS